MLRNNTPITTHFGGKPFPTVQISQEQFLKTKLEDVLQKAISSIVKAKEEYLLNWLGAKNYQQALDILSRLREYGYRVQVDYENEVGTFDAKNDESISYTIEAQIRCRLVEACEQPWCNNDMTEMKCFNNKQSCVDHCGEDHTN